MKALVAGGLGVTGRALINYLSTLSEWDAVAISRRIPEFETSAQYISLDLTDSTACEQVLSNVKDITHIFFAAYQQQASLAQESVVNLGLLKNLVEAVESTSSSLQRVVLMQGGKVYGVHLGAYKTPAKETDARHMPPDFYYDQEDYLRSRSQQTGWTWTALRPSAVCGFAVGNPMNLLTAIAMYAVISKELGLPLRFPGKKAAYSTLFEVTDATLLAKAMVWAATEKQCSGQAFNITNGDFFRWEHVWSTIAAHFNLEVGYPQPLNLVEFMADKAALWDSLVQRHKLQPYKFEEIASWAYADACFALDYDIMSDTLKARQHGFADCFDSEQMFLNSFQKLQVDRIIP